MPFRLFEKPDLWLPRLTLLRLFPLLGAVALWRVEATSAVEMSLWALTGVAAHVCLFGYAALLLVLAVCPMRVGWLHPIGSALAVLVIGGRMAGFAQIMFDGRPDLEGAVWERAWLLAAVLIWHWTASAMIGRAKARGTIT